MNQTSPHRMYRRSLPKHLSSLVDFLQDFTDCVRNPEDLVKGISGELGPFLRRPGLVPEDWLRPERDGYGRNMLFRGDRYVLLCMVWPAGISSPIHDHGTWGVVGVLRNKITITDYERLDEGTKPGYAKLRLRKKTVATRGGVGHVLPPQREIHMMHNPTERLSATLHIYGKEITSANRFDLKANAVERYCLRYTNL